jgi:hypothetical protein
MAERSAYLAELLNKYPVTIESLNAKIERVSDQQFAIPG